MSCLGVDVGHCLIEKEEEEEEEMEANQEVWETLHENRPVLVSMAQSLGTK